MAKHVNAVCPQRILSEAVRLMETIHSYIPLDKCPGDILERIDSNQVELVALSTALPNMWPPMPKTYNYIASTYAISGGDNRITDIAELQLLFVSSLEAGGMESRSSIYILEPHVQAVLDHACSGCKLGFVYRATSRHDTRIIIRPVIVDQDNGRFLQVGPMYDGEKLIKTLIMADFLSRWADMKHDAQPSHVITALAA